MGMSIEEKAINTLNEIIDEGWLISDMEKCTAIDACEFAIDRIRKCQKIQEIVAKWEEEVHSGVSCSYDRMEDIKEVVENGSENNHHASNT